MREARGDEREQLSYAFRLCTGRTPDPRELDRLARLLDGELAHFRADPKAAAEVCRGGEVRPPAGLDTARMAALTMVANVLLNLDETLTKG